MNLGTVSGYAGFRFEAELSAIWSLRSAGH